MSPLSRFSHANATPLVGFCAAQVEDDGAFLAHSELLPPHPNQQQKPAPAALPAHGGGAGGRGKGAKGKGAGRAKRGKAGEDAAAAAPEVVSSGPGFYRLAGIVLHLGA